MTIKRDSISVNRDKDRWKQGTSESEQVLARALLTPDELRRLDSDLCIIYEKGIKPIKANKYYYFDYPTANIPKRYPLSHVDMEPIDRGVWRKYNPYKPYEDDTNEGNEKIESLDDLFEDEPEKEEKPELIQQDAILPSVEEDIEQEKPQEETKKEPLSVDIQKELEDKFDELFGSFDSDTSDNKNT